MNISPEIIGLIDEIRGNKTHGASQLARQAAGVLKLAAERSRANSAEAFRREMREAGEGLMSARPAMAPISNIVNGLLEAISKKSRETDLDLIRYLATSNADQAVSDSLKATAQTARRGSELIADGDRLMTHSYSSTVVETLKKALSKDIEVIIARSGPGRSGERAARELAPHGISVTFIDDAAMGLYIPTVSRVMVGADRVCIDGKIVNGIGTYQLALAAETAGIPFYVLCETLKFDPRLRGDEVDMEEKEPSEVVEPGRLPPEARVKNPYFDLTPPELVTGIITEKGLLTPEEAISYMKRPPD